MTFAVILIIAFIFYFLLAWQDLKLGLAAIILLLPSYLVRFQISFLPMTFLEVLILIIFVVWLLKLARHHLKWEYKDFWWPILFFVLAGIAATLVSADVEAGLGLWKAYILEPVLFFLVFINVIKNKKDVRLIIYSLAVLSIFISLYAILQYFGIIYSPEPYFSEMPRRVTSVFPFPTAIGKLLGPIAAIFLGLFIVKKKEGAEIGFSKREKILFLTTFVFIILGFLVSVNRGAMLGVGAAFIFLSFFSYYKKWIWLCLAVLIIIAFILPMTRHQIFSIATGTDTSTDVHLVMWKGTWRLLEARPIQGAGLGGFPTVYNLYRDPAHVELFPNPDNLYLTLWAEMGLAGSVACIWLMIEFFRRARHLRKKFQDNSFVYILTIGLVASMVALLVHGLVDTPYFKNDLAVAFWVVVGLLVVISRPLQKPENAL